MKQGVHSIKKLEKFRSQLAKNSLRATSQRLAVHEAMMELGHACADDVHRWISDNSDTPVTVSSVYNILSQMESLGIYQCRSSMDNKMYFDIVTGPHLHLYDYVKHKYRDINDDNLLQDVMQAIGQRRFKGYNIERIDIQFIAKPAKRKKITETQR